jgi:hypothetical protein
MRVEGRERDTIVTVRMATRFRVELSQMSSYNEEFHQWKIEPKFETEKDPPWNSSGFSLLSLALVARSFTVLLILDRPLLSAPAEGGKSSKEKRVESIKITE